MADNIATYVTETDGRIDGQTECSMRWLRLRDKQQKDCDVRCSCLAGWLSVCLLSANVAAAAPSLCRCCLGAWLLVSGVSGRTAVARQSPIWNGVIAVITVTPTTIKEHAPGRQHRTGLPTDRAAREWTACRGPGPGLGD